MSCVGARSACRRGEAGRYPWAEGIQLPAGVGATYQNTAPSMDPLRIYSDENVEVRATLVPHGPVFPAYGFRFDTEYGSVTFPATPVTRRT